MGDVLGAGWLRERNGLVQRYFGTAIGKGRQAAKTEVERLKLGEITCEQGVTEVAKMCALPSLPLS